MSKMKKKRAVSLLLCLGIVATMSVGSMTVSADNMPYTNEQVIDTLYENDYIKADGKSYTISKDGYYLFLSRENATEDGKADWYDVFADSAEPKADFTELLDGFKHYSVGDTLNYNEKTAHVPAYMLYKAKETDEYTAFDVSLGQPLSDPYADASMFNWEFTEATEDKAVVHIKAEARGGAELSTYTLRLNGELYGDLSPDAENAIPVGVSSYEFDIPLYDNGEYTLYMTDTFGVTENATFTVDCINENKQPDPDADKDDLPQMSYFLSTNDTGLSQSDSLVLTVTTDKACTIYGNGFTAQDNTTSAEFQIFKNGVYKFFAVDPNTDATSELSVTVTSFGDGSFDLPSDDTDNNDNPVNPNNRDNYWQDLVENGDLSADGKLIDLVALNIDEDGNVTSKNNKSNPSDKLGVLPQTGITSWVVAIGCSLFAIIAGTFLMFHKGIFKKLSRKGGK